MKLINKYCRFFMSRPLIFEIGDELLYSETAGEAAVVEKER